MTAGRAHLTACLVLAALAGGSQPGTGIIAEVAHISGGRVRLRVGTLYLTLDRLRADGLVGVDREEISGRAVRRYYGLARPGAARLAAETAGSRAGAATAGLTAGATGSRAGAETAGLTAGATGSRAGAATAGLTAGMVIAGLAAAAASMAGRPDLRVGDAERDAAAAALGEHFARGRLTAAELGERLDTALTATTQGELTRATWDLP